MNELSYLVFDPDLVSAYDELPLWSAMFGLLLLENVPLAEVRVALDVGCGTGFPLGARVHGVDPWRAALARAGEKIAHRSISNVTLHDASGAAMPFGDESFDLIVSNLGVNNFDDAAAVVRECRRVSRDGATLVLTTNLQGHMHEFYAVFEDVLNATGGGEAVQRLHEHVSRRSTVAGTRTLLERGGFAVSRVVERTTNSGFSERGRRSWPDRKRPFFRACRSGSIPMRGRGVIFR